MRIRATALSMALVGTLLACSLARPATIAAQERHEGITVHGHWVIDVRNPDGTLVSHRDFENALLATGKTYAAQLISGAAVPGPWGIALKGDSTNGAICTAGVAGACGITQGSASDFGFGVTSSSNLTLTPGSGSFTLSGSIQASSRGSIASVETWQATCVPTVSPAACTVAAAWTQVVFTGTTLTDPSTNQPSPVIVQAGQIVQVSVTISFS